jgi:F5/8 type C domain/RTX calcium-binding nonapeptide repeat (4 copies)/WD40-like Beta Propeller Repeat
MRSFLFLLAGVLGVVSVCGTAAAPAEGLPRVNGRLVFLAGDTLASYDGANDTLWGLNQQSYGETDWSPDGTTIAYSGLAGTDGKAIYTVDPDGSNRHRLTSRTYANNPSFSPDGTQIAYDDYTRIYVADADGTNERPLATGGDPSWSPDGRFIAYTSNPTLTGSNEEILLYELATGFITNLTSSPARDLQADWSPDGTKLVFASLRADRAGGFSLYTINRDGTGVRALTDTGADFEPAWSPDGAWIAFARFSQLWRVAADGLYEERLIENGPSTSPAWQPLPSGPPGCTIWGTRANDVLVGTPGRDIICGLEGNDTLIGQEGRDELRGGAGSDWLAGGLGNDRLYGGHGDDLLDLRDGASDSAFAGAGRDRALIDPKDRSRDRRAVERVTLSRNVAAWHPTEASSETASNPSVLAVDGRVDDFWSSGGQAPQWVEVDLLKPTAIASLRVVANQLPTNAALLVLGRGPNVYEYHLLHRFNGPTINRQALSFTPRKPWRGIRYVRLQVPSSPIGAGWFADTISLPELEIYAPRA